MSHFVFCNPPNYYLFSNLNSAQLLEDQIQALFLISNSSVDFNILTPHFVVTLDLKREYLHRALAVASAVMPLFTWKHDCNLITQAEYLKAQSVHSENLRIWFIFFQCVCLKLLCLSKAKYVFPCFLGFYQSVCRHTEKGKAMAIGIELLLKYF